MKPFNKFTPFLDTCEKCGEFHILAIEGDLNKWSSNRAWVDDIGENDRGKFGGMKENPSFSERKTDSDKSLNATIWTFDARTNTFSKKNLYRNSKGVFFNTQDRKPITYLILEPLPESMK